MIDLDQMTVELVQDEGKRNTVYDDATADPIRPGSRVAGHPTIGIGRALDIHGISDNEAYGMLHNDLLLYVEQLDPLPWFAAMDANRQRAIVNMRHQLGLQGLLGFSAMIQAVTLQQWNQAASDGLASQWATQTPRRAERAMRLLRTGIARES